jgi:hypothetical protein
MILSLEQRIGGRVDLDPGEKELLACGSVGAERGRGWMAVEPLNLLNR